MNKIEIERIQNGYIISWEEEGIDNKIYTAKQVIEIKDEYSEMADKDTLTELFYFIAEHFGEIYNKFNENNLNIQWDRKGHKLE